LFQLKVLLLQRSPPVGFYNIASTNINTFCISRRAIKILRFYFVSLKKKLLSKYVSPFYAIVTAAKTSRARFVSSANARTTDNDDNDDDDDDDESR